MRRSGWLVVCGALIIGFGLGAAWQFRILKAAGLTQVLEDEIEPTRPWTRVYKAEDWKNELRFVHLESYSTRYLLVQDIPSGRVAFAPQACEDVQTEALPGKPWVRIDKVEDHPAAGFRFIHFEGTRQCFFIAQNLKTRHLALGAQQCTRGE